MSDKIYAYKDILPILNKQIIGTTIKNSQSPLFNKVAPISRAQEMEITFCNEKGGKARSLIKNVNEATILVNEDLQLDKDLNHSKLIFVKDPRLSLARILRVLFEVQIKPQIHPTAVISKTARIGKNTFIGPCTTIGDNVSIGNDCEIHGNVTLYPNTIIGNRVKIHSGTVIGSEGFGFQINEEGIYESIPHIGGVILENDITIGSNTSIDRGTIDDTVIKKGVKIDNLVHIAHNVIIEENSRIVACAEISGSTTIGKNSWVGPNTTISDKLKIGDSTDIKLGSTVVRDLLPGEAVSSNFAIKHRENMNRYLEITRKQSTKSL